MDLNSPHDIKRKKRVLQKVSTFPYQIRKWAVTPCHFVGVLNSLLVNAVVFDLKYRNFELE